LRNRFDDMAHTFFVLVKFKYSFLDILTIYTEGSHFFNILIINYLISEKKFFYKLKPKYI
jgi:hypothetical protein